MERRGRGDMQSPSVKAGLALVWASQEEQRERVHFSTVKQWQVAQARAEAVVDVVTSAWGVQIEAVPPVRHIALRAAPPRNIVGVGITKEHDRVQDEKRSGVHRQGAQAGGRSAGVAKPSCRQACRTDTPRDATRVALA
jgi:hypothetical protein